MLLSTIAKAMHKALRPKLYAHVDCKAPATLLGGRKGASVVFGSHLVKSFCRWQLAEKRSFAVIFADVASAYYCSIRELTARAPHAKVTPQMLDFVDTSHDGLVQQLGCPSILSQGGASSWLEAIAAEMHRRTWFTMAGDGQPVQTRRGSRPGSTFADLMFSAGISAIMSVKEQLRMNTPGVLPKPSVPWDGRRDLSACEIPSYQIELGEIVWADDVAECLAFPKADQAIGQTAKSASILAEAFATFGYTLTFGATKTAALIKAQGDGSRQVRGALFRGKATLPVLLETSAPAALPLVAAYKHLGVMQTGGLSMLPELRQRCGSAWAAFRQGRKAVYRNRRLTLHKRGILLTSAVLSRLFYGAGAWHTLRVGEERVVNGTMLNILRQTLCVPHAEDQHVCRAEMCALLGVPDPCTCMRVERLRYVRQAVAAAPDVPWALMRLDSALMAAYRDAFRWLFQALRATTTLPDPLVEWDPWLKVMCASPGRFRGWTKRAKRLAVLRLTCGAALSALARAVRQVGQAREPTLRVPGATAYTEACLPCGIAFCSRTAWACHASKLHGYRTKATLLTSGIQEHWCRACGKVYSCAGRLRRHLAYSQACQDAWGSFGLDTGVPAETVHPLAPPRQLPGRQVAVGGPSSSPLVHSGLLDALLHLQNPSEDEVWATVVDFIAPLEHLRRTLQEWAAHDQAQPGAHTLASNATLLLDPDLCCDRFKGPKSEAKGLDFMPLLEPPEQLAFDFILSGPVFTLRLDSPPLPEFRYPFACSVPLTAAERHAKWFESACDTVGAFVQQAQYASVVLEAASSAIACLEPLPSWLTLGGFERFPAGLRSPRG